MNVLCRMKAAGALVSAVPRSIGPRRYTQGRFRKRSGAWVHAGTSAPCVVHACSTVAAITASQTVPVSGGSAAASTLRSARLVVDAVVVAGEALDDEPLEGGGVPARPRLGRQLAQLGCGDSLASARACLPRFARLHVRPGVGSQCRTQFADGGPPVSAAVGACGAVALPSPDWMCKGEDTGGAVELTRLARGSPGLGRVTSRAHHIRRICYRPGGERSPSHLRVWTRSPESRLAAANIA